MMPAHSAAYVALATVVLALVAWAVLPPDTLKALLREGAPVEAATAALFLLLPGALWALRRPDDEPRTLWALSVLFLAFGAREMDLHRFPGSSVLKVSFYLGDAPLEQKLVAGVAVAAVAAAFLQLAVRHARPLWRAFRRRESWAITVVWFIGIMALSKVLDRSINLLAQDFGLDAPTAVRGLVAALEEIMELGLPVMAGIALLQRRPSPPRERP
jgi:hypothetical protein